MYFKQRKSWVDTGQPSTSTFKIKLIRKEDNVLRLVGSKGVVCYEIFKFGKTVNTARYQQMIHMLFNTQTHTFI